MFCLLQSVFDLMKKGLTESLKLQKDLEEQIKCSEEEVIVLKERLTKLEEENKNLDRELNSHADTILRMSF